MSSESAEARADATVFEPERLAELPEKYMCAKVGRDLTWQAQEEGGDPLLGRDKEVERVIRRLTKTRAKNVLVMGESGIGKTALVEEIARRIVMGEVPPTLRGTRLIQTSFSRMWSHAGKSEDWAGYGRVLNAVLKECACESFILVMEDFHLLNSYEYSMSYIRPALETGDLAVIGTSTSRGFYNYLESDRATLRLFDVLRLTEPSPAETLTIVRRASGRWATRAQTSPPEEDILALLVHLADTYISHQAQPGKSLQLLERAIDHRNLRSGDSGFTDEDVRQAAAELAGIDAELLDPRLDRLEAMETALNSVVLGQEQAIKKLSRRVYVSQSQLSVTPERPLGVFLLVGPTGTGKSLTGKELARFMTGDERNLIQLDMNSFLTRDSALAITGVPGEQSSERRQFMPPLTRQLKERSYSVLLLDEIEKAHPAILLMFLQAIDSGRFRDSLGNEASLRGCVVLMTSNVGYGLTGTRRTVGLLQPETDWETESLRAVKETFPKEFLGRIDEVLVFRPLSREIMRRFVAIRLQRLERLSGKHISITPAALDLLCDRGFHIEYGARDLNRTIDEVVGYPLAKLKHSPDWERTREITIETAPANDSLLVQPTRTSTGGTDHE